MPDIAPLRGILYDPARVDPAKVIAPPYDVIDPDERARLAGADPHNCVRLILPEADGGADRYAAAARTLDAWLASGVLKRDDRKSVYRYNQVFTHLDVGPAPVTRTGFIAAVRLHPFTDKVILPHERTLRGPKEDRLALMKATSSHFSQIFTMFKDSSGEVERLFKKTEKDAPIVDATTADGVRHMMWRCNDAETIGKLRHHMAPKKLYIADGHHRYETMLALRDHFAAGREDGLSTYSSAQYGTMFLSTMDQPGLVVLPTHRILHSLQGFSPASLLEKVREFFLVDKIENGVAKPQLIRAAIASAENHQPGFAVVFPGEKDAWRLILDPQANTMALGLATKSIAKLDVTLLHSLVLEKVLGITPAAQEAQTNLRYVKDTTKAIAEAAKPGTQAVFLMTPSAVDSVKQVADRGEIMPQKSTYFFPKIASGLVINRIDPDEDLV